MTSSCGADCGAATVTWMSQGDHAVVVLEVVAAERHGDLQPLTVAASPWEYGG